MPTITFVPPSFSVDEIQAIGRRHYGIDQGGEPLPSERDQNVVLQDARHRRYVVKISNAEEDPRVIDLQNAALAHLAAAAPDLDLPRVQHTVDGAAVISVPDAQGTPHLVRAADVGAGDGAGGRAPAHAGAAAQPGIAAGRDGRRARGVLAPRGGARSEVGSAPRRMDS